MSELLPCPFCGREVKIEGGAHKSIFCIRCRTFDFYDADTERMARKWNTRNYPAEVQQAIARMKPMKVINKWSQHGIEYGDCPTCICPVEGKFWEDHQHCDRCGQALDWEV